VRESEDQADSQGFACVWVALCGRDEEAWEVGRCGVRGARLKSVWLESV
jgi:hypothetical protein